MKMLKWNLHKSFSVIGMIVFLILLDSADIYAQATDNFGQIPPPDSVRIHYDVTPKFPGNIMKYLSDSIRYPKEAEEKGIRGIVWIDIVVEKDGSHSIINIVSSSDSLLNREAIRVISSMPKWIPAKENGVVVRSHFSIPIHFNLPPVSGGVMEK